MRGMRVFHDLEDLHEGEEVILTLQDSSILDDLGNLNDGADGGVLVNQELFEKHKAEFNTNLRQNAKRLGNVTTAHLDDAQEELLGSRALLPHYDERRFEKSGIALDESGNFDVEQMQQLDLIKHKLKSKKNAVESLETLNANQIASDYKTPEAKSREKEAAAGLFKKKKKAKKDAATSSGGTTSLLDYLEENADTEAEDKFENRKKMKTERHQQELKLQLIDQRAKRENYEKAVQNSNAELADSKKRLEDVEDAVAAEEYEAAAAAEAEEAQREKNRLLLDDDDENLLQLSIERARVQELRARESAKLASKSSDAVKELLDQTHSIVDEQRAQAAVISTSIASAAAATAGKGFAAPQSKGGKPMKSTSSAVIDINEINFSEDSLKFIETDESRKTGLEFVYKSETKKSLGDTQNGTTSVVSVSMPTERFKGKRYHDHIQEEEDFQKKLLSDNMTDEEYNKIVNELEEIGLHKETLGSGLSGFLKELEDRGVLANDNLDYSGRNLDKVPHKDGTLTRDKDRIQLEYRDDTGKIMTKQQAFRYLCWKFHGQGPSRNKLEKIKLKELEKEKQRVKNLGEDSIIMKNLKSSQKITNQPYLVLQKKN